MPKRFDHALTDVFVASMGYDAAGFEQRVREMRDKLRRNCITAAAAVSANFCPTGVERGGVPGLPQKFRGVLNALWDMGARPVWDVWSQTWRMALMSVDLPAHLGYANLNPVNLRRAASELPSLLEGWTVSLAPKDTFFWTWVGYNCYAYIRDTPDGDPTDAGKDSLLYSWVGTIREPILRKQGGAVERHSEETYAPALFILEPPQ